MKRLFALGVVLSGAVGCSDAEGPWEQVATDYIVEQCDADSVGAQTDRLAPTASCEESVVTFSLVGFANPDSEVVVNLGNGTVSGTRGAIFGECLLRMELLEPAAISEAEVDELETALESTTVGRRDPEECNSGIVADGDYRIMFVGDTRFSEGACDVLDGEDEAFQLADSLFDQRATVLERFHLENNEWVATSVEVCPSPGGN